MSVNARAAARTSKPLISGSPRSSTTASALPARIRLSRGGAVTRLEHEVSLRAECLHGERADRLVVIDDQHADVWLRDRQERDLVVDGTRLVEGYGAGCSGEWNRHGHLTLFVDR